MKVYSVRLPDDLLALALAWGKVNGTDSLSEIIRYALAELARK